MIPPLNCVRYLGRPEFDAGVARIVVDALRDHLSSNPAASTLSADCVKMHEYMDRYLRIMYREPDQGLQVETVAALTKRWISVAWGGDLMSDPRSGAPFKWKVSEKAFDYGNRERILPPAEATQDAGRFAEYRPYGSIPGTMRLFKGKTMWWVTNNGTHGSVADCRSADWWVWPMSSANWFRWTVTGATAASGPGAQGVAVPLPADLSLKLSPRELKVLSLMRANHDNAMDDSHFTSVQLWHDAGVMLA
ncbi:hypothetical protein [Rubrivivax rivuli]|uniref:Uncharacterized protein n=1 Tax=Rubrivivax rivuli TaxID=1862385 RepID=A0A437RAI2_9BURK|nr:hypothetical protein [Rubrivivax rivuli]RVU43697.1 hypothetical protein EOE66_18640 [Rubrivivax rivuli]